MKKFILSTGLVALMSFAAHGVYADEMLVEAPEKIAMGGDMMYYPESNFTLEKIKAELAGRNGESIIEENFDMISGNSVWELYEYNSTHYYSKQLQASLYIPEGLQRYISQTQVRLTKDGTGPIMYDMPQAKEMTESVVSGNDMVVKLDSELFAATSEGYNPAHVISFIIDPQELRAMITDEYGASFTMQVELVMQNGKVIPYSQIGYFYVQTDNLEGKKSHLANYYSTLNPSAGYPDLDSMLKAAFAKLRAKSADSDAYLASLKKVRAKVDLYTQNYTAEIEKMTADINSDEGFDAIVKDYGKVYARSNLLWDIGYRIDSEMTNDDAQKLIDELFTIAD